MRAPVSLVLAARYLRGRGLRSLLTTLAVMFGVMLVFGLNGIVPTMIDTFTTSLLRTAGKIDLSVASTFNQPFGPDVLDRVARTPGVAAATGAVQRPVPVTPASGSSVQVMVIGVDPATAASVRDFPLAGGRQLTVADDGVLVVASDLAGRLGLGLGDQVRLPSAVGTTTFTVVGLLATPTGPGQEQVFVPVGAAQRMFALGERITVVEASLTGDADRAQVEDAVRAALGPDYTVGGLSTNASMLASLETSVFAFNLFGVFALATAGFIIANSFRTVIAERRRDIGMLRAIGASRRTIQRMFVAESVLQGVIGTALGLVAGYAMARALFAVMGPIVTQFMHLELGELVFTPGTWALAIGLGVGVTVLAAIVPARAAGRVTPMEALRPQVGEVYQRRVGKRAWLGVGLVVVAVFCLATRDGGLVGLGAVLFLIAMALVAPVIVNPLAGVFGALVEIPFAREGALARSNLQRNPARSATTVTAVMLGLASIVAMMSVVGAIFAGFMSYIDKSLGSDYLVIPQSIVLQQGNVAAGPRLAEDVRRLDGVGVVSTLRLASGKVNGADAQVIGLDPVTYAQVASLDWSGTTTDAALDQLSTGRWLIANGIFAGQNALTEGQAVTLDTPNGPRTYHVAGIGNDYLNAKLATVYVSQANLARDFNTTADLLIMADRSPDADPDAVRARLDALVGEYPAFRLYEASQWKDEQLATFGQTMGIFYALIAALALPSLLALLNTLAISVLARTREIGMLRAVGATRRQITRMIVAESLLLSLIGSVFAVVAGILLGFALVSALRTVGWPMPWTLPWGAVLVTLVVGVAFGVLAALGPARTASRLDVVEALHHE